MPTKLAIAGVVALVAIGATLNDHMKVPWRNMAPLSNRSDLGYLTPEELSDSVSVLPPPPVPGSEALKSDELARQAALREHGTPRYALAAADAARDQPTTVRRFECAFGTDISPQRTPTLYMLLSRVRLDVRAMSYPAKNQYRRPRPYAVHNARSCYPDDEAMTRNDGSYPSARGAVGAAYASVLAKLRPDRADAVRTRGRDFGESRVVCDQEWQSDVDAGRKLATVALRRLEKNEAFEADMTTARKEVAAELVAGVKPTANCPLEQLEVARR